jgi:hypothetical protein
MKKVLLTSLSLMLAGFCTAQIRVEPAKLNVNAIPELVKPYNPPTVITGSGQFMPSNSTSSQSRLNDRRTGSISYVKIGNTLYDLQTNSSMPRRIILHPDGKITATFTTSTSVGAFANRGTGYNHFDGTNWMSVTSPTPRIESSRTGWPAIGIYDGNKEYILGHVAETGGFVLSKNQGIGLTTFTETSVLTEVDAKPIWGRTASNNENIIHVISNYTVAEGDPIPTKNGVPTPMHYSRSTDAGATWDKLHTLLPGYDSTRIEGGSADNYSIDCRDSIVAIVSGRLGHDVILWKSTNNGDSFTKIYVDSFPFDPTKFRERITDDTAFCSDGTNDVFIDENGKIHVFFALSQVFTNPNDNEAYFFRPATVGLVYWNDSTEEQVLVTDYIPFDRDNNNTIDINPGNWSALANGQIPTNIPGVFSVARLGNTSLLRMPSSGIDADGNIYVVFTVPVEYAQDFNQLNYRDVFIMHSTDGGTTWEGPQNLTQTFQLEEDFVAMAKVVDDYVHIIYQRDNIPGTNLQNNAEGASNHGISPDGNDIFYAAIPKSEILAGTIGNTYGLSVEDLSKDSRLFVVSQNYPNPFTGETTVTVYLSQFTSNLNIDVIDITGKQVYTHQIQNLTQGNHDITFDGSNLKSGVYYYTISTGNSTQTRKMIIH